MSWLIIFVAFLSPSRNKTWNRPPPLHLSVMFNYTWHRRRVLTAPSIVPPSPPGRDKKCLQIFSLTKLREERHFENLGIEGKVIFKYILKNQDRFLWTGLIWLRIVTSNGHLIAPPGHGTPLSPFPSPSAALIVGCFPWRLMTDRRHLTAPP
jgi:hypothetical protein